MVGAGHLHPPPPGNAPTRQRPQCARLDTPPPGPHAGRYLPDRTQRPGAGGPPKTRPPRNNTTPRHTGRTNGGNQPMTKTKTTLLRLTIASILAITATALTTATASAQPKQALFSFCKKVGALPGASFTSAACRSTEQSNTGTAEWTLAYADLPGALLLCLLKTGGGYKNLFCNELGTGTGESGIELNTSFGGAPTILGISTALTLKSSIGGNPFVISCAKDQYSFQPEDSGKFSEGKLEYTGCRAPKPSGCTVKEPIIGSFNGQLLAADRVLFIGNREARNTAKTKETFAEISYENNSSCIVKNQTFPVHGQQLCEGAVGILTLKLLQTLSCRASESSLKLGEEPETLENEVSLHATNKEYWAILLVTL